MEKRELEEVVKSNLDSSCNTTQTGQVYWRARELQDILAYEKWENFKNVIDKAIKGCSEAGVDVADHFLDVGKMITLGKGGKRVVEDYILSKYACYLVAMNGDSSNRKIASAQNYFAVQTIRMEQEDQENNAADRIELRSKVTEANKSLGNIAKSAGVINYGAFHNAGYRGLYGMSLKDIKTRKSIEKGDLLDRSGHSELAANYFRITQTDEKIRREQIKGEMPATNAHLEVGAKVRETIIGIGGTLPEDMPLETDIKVLAKQEVKKNIGKLS